MDNNLISILNVMNNKERLEDIIDKINDKLEQLESEESSFEEVAERNIPLKEWRDYAKTNKELINNNEKLYEVKVDGNCEFGALSLLIYNTEDANRVRREIVKYMLKLSFGDQYMNKYQELYKDYIKGINAPILSEKSRILNEPIKDFWESIIPNFDIPENIKTLNAKVAYLTAKFMEGLPGISDIPEWGDNYVIPHFASDLYEITLCIDTINRNKKFNVDKCSKDFATLIENDKEPRKLILYNKGLNNHFDVVISKDYKGLLDKAEIAKKKLS
jgi:hypothetical protein